MTATTPVPDSFDPEELETWSTLATLLEWLPAALDAQLQRDAGMSHFEFGILFALSRTKDGTLRMSELAGYANSTLSRLSRAAARLERRGWLRRAPDPGDGRITIAVLTEAGRDAMLAAEPGHVALVRQLVFAPLTRTQAMQLERSARRINGTIRAKDGWSPSA
ncbi:DNA-binding MarR family transcriptional regulator [Stackebrandtia endophytica]|uniref:DNA-binding MarR family transcriptional regulator n=1 Tax=Stackebrandtia endophytica TaxID=1496996 RepID=A0A543B2H2_9ACTN|nr:MarR family transcriptional regulator [Stackebrandtia endophytica]TQL79022.1 DNA-binding MarR family transcriptional regulator [Stackebrandtia endophytica]